MPHLRLLQSRVSRPRHYYVLREDQFDKRKQKIMLDF